MSVLTPNMNLVQSTIGVDSGLNWEMNQNSSLTTIDQHNHSSGNGVPITPSGINISTALPFNNNQATGLQAAVFSNQTSLSTPNALYAIAGDLYYNDPTGVIQLTLGGAVNATSSGISSGSASAAFSAGVLVVNAAANTPANIQVGSVLLGNNVSGSNFLTLSPPSAMGASFSLTLPNVPASTKIMIMDSSGNMSASYGVDNSTIEVSSSNLQVKAQGITSVQIANGTITTTQIGSGTITGSNIAIGTVTGTNIATGTVTSSNIAASTITGSNIASDTIPQSADQVHTSVAYTSGSGAFGPTFGYTNVALISFPGALVGRFISVTFMADPTNFGYFTIPAGGGFYIRVSSPTWACNDWIPPSTTSSVNKSFLVKSSLTGTETITVAFNAPNALNVPQFIITASQVG